MFTNQNKNQINEYYMNLALNYARMNIGNTRTNPSVGCVIIKNGNILGAATTSFNGRPHAEHNAIKNSKHDLENSILYSTLEPCSNYGKTAPCVNLIIKKKIKKVFFSIKDPDLRSFDKSTSKLKKFGIKVNAGILKDKINYFYKSYKKFKSNKLPFVTCKLAISKDFYTINKNKKWITNEYSRGRVHLMRSSHDCIITSSKTVNNDDPMLTCRINGLENRSPTRVILDKNLTIKINSKIIKTAEKYKTIIFYNKNDVRKIKNLKKMGIKTYQINLDNNLNLNLFSVLSKLKKLGFTRIFLESGIKLIKSFLRKNLVDEFKLFISKKNLGKKGNGNAKDIFSKFLVNKKKEIPNVNLFGDKLFSYHFR
tara:strand:- start:4387 stop:5490 length:1104 start_codon:yes stop_codon:yes gene_type:complete